MNKNVPYVYFLQWIHSPHHGEEDYGRVGNLGFNSVRFYMNYGLYEEDANPYVYKQDGFDWLNRTIAWTRAAGIYLVLNMHYPQGGFIEL